MIDLKYILLLFKKHFNKKYMPNWTCFHVSISQEMTGISVWMEVSLDSISQLWHRVFPHWVAIYEKTTIRYIGQCVSSLNLAGLIFSSSPLLPLSFFCAFLPSFSFFCLFLESFSPAKDPGFSHRAWCWRLSNCFLLQGNREGGGGRLTSWLPTRGLCQCEKNQGRRIWWWQSNCVS